MVAQYSVMIAGMAPFGGLLAGVVADRFGAPATVATGGMICLASTGIFWTQLAEIRVQMRRMTNAQREAMAEKCAYSWQGLVVAPPALGPRGAVLQSGDKCVCWLRQARPITPFADGSPLYPRIAQSRVC